MREADHVRTKKVGSEQKSSHQEILAVGGLVDRTGTRKSGLPEVRAISRASISTGSPNPQLLNKS
jgi:hypothetical protein